jgi:prepilin-type N-terminal cleavage/methylation domain-containing protein/prepilin-type processing-associated H-X9-DG protein
MRWSSRRRAFTLIELLVVVAVILILAGLVLPTAMRSLSHAASAECTNNLKQIYTGLLTYLKEFGYFAAAGDNEWKRWHVHVEKILSTDRVFHCPLKNDSTTGYGVNYRYYMGPNYAGMEWPYPYLWYNVLSVNTVQSPSECVYVTDVGYVTNNDAPIREWTEDMNAEPRGFVRFPQLNAPIGVEDLENGYPYWINDPWYPMARHPAKKVNCAYFDGSVRGEVIEDLVTHNYLDPECIYDYK